MHGVLHGVSHRYPSLPKPELRALRTGHLPSWALKSPFLMMADVLADAIGCHPPSGDISRESAGKISFFLGGLSNNLKQIQVYIYI